MPLSTGQVLNNRYRIVKLLGQGGFGAVYRAWDTNLNGPCAVKENFDTSPAAQAQFQREASMLFNLRHPNLPRVFDAFSVPGQGQYLVMDYIEGEDLSKMLERTGAPLSEPQVLAWIRQVCDALQYLHEQTPPIIHRDLKPANIRITPKGQAVLVDFGIAKMYDPNLRTTIGARAVTPGYSPNEQYLSQGRTDPRTDIYALGATLFTLFTCQTPPEAPERNMGVALPSIRSINPAVSPKVERAVMKAMEIAPDRRYQNIAELSKELVTQLAAISRPQAAAGTPYSIASNQAVGQPISQSQAPSFQTLTTSLQSQNFKWLFALGGVILVAIIGWAVWSGFMKNAVKATSILDTDTPFAPFRISATPRPTATSLPTDTPTPQVILLPTRETLPPLPQADYPGKVLIPAGEFQMGSEDGESDEKPVHTVYLDAYYIDIYEVTNAQYAACVQTGSCTPPEATLSSQRDNYYGNTVYDNYPVIYVDWNQAQAYCQWRGGDLPTEAQWEKAARGTTISVFPWGDQSPSCELANIDFCLGDTIQVGSYPSGVSRQYGIFDLAGNVWEWVKDWYQSDYYSTSPDDNPLGPKTGNLKIVRGGGWGDSSFNLRVSMRNEYDQKRHENGVGFRCASSTSTLPTKTPEGILSSTEELFPFPTLPPFP